VGNSSAGIKEASYLGLPVVNIGWRQNGRTRADNVLDVAHEKAAIKAAIEKQFAVGRYPKSSLYYKPDTSGRMAEILATIDLYIQKTFHDKD